MDEILKYENRDRLYSFLVNEFGFVKSEERYDSVSFGNYFIILSGKEFLIRYINDRHYMTIEIASHAETSHWMNLAFIKKSVYRKVS